MCEENKIKVCKKCGIGYPATIEYFHIHNGCKDGLNTICKKCRSKKARNRRMDISEEILKSGYKRCLDCGEILSLDKFNTYATSADSHYDICIECQKKRRRNGAKEGYKKCHKCGRIFPLNRDYFQPEERCIDGFRNFCWECMGRNFCPDYANESWCDDDINIVKENYLVKNIKDIIPLLSVTRTEKSIMHVAQKLGIRKINNYIENYSELKYKIIDDVLHKYCKGCNRYLPFSFDYFPKDEHCTDGFRNVCRECKGENFLIDAKRHYWTEDEENLLKEKYPYYSNNEIIFSYFPNMSSASIMRKAKELDVYKTEETLQRIWSYLGEQTSNRLLLIDKWKDEDNPQYNSQRFGDLNPHYKGGISNITQELRRNIKEWKIDSMENCNFKCFISGDRFDVIHHLYSFDNIVRDTFIEMGLPIYNNISSYNNDELESIINKCLEIHYRYPLGVCLAEKYHLKFHDVYGYGDNTPEQFYQFLSDYYEGKYKDLQEVV